jgi:hypothetical protein
MKVLVRILESEWRMPLLIGVWLLVSCVGVSWISAKINLNLTLSMALVAVASFGGMFVVPFKLSERIER